MRRRSGKGAEEGPCAEGVQHLAVVLCRMKTILSNQTVDIPEQGTSACAGERRVVVLAPQPGNECLPVLSSHCVTEGPDSHCQGPQRNPEEGF